MKPDFTPGRTTSRELVVDDARAISFMGDDCRVYATPSIVNDVEFSCRNFLLEHLEPGEDSVGTLVHLEHVGPALLGEKVTIDVKVAAIDGRRVTFEAQVHAGKDRVAHGTHERFVVDVAKVRERLLKRRAGLGL